MNLATKLGTPSANSKTNLGVLLSLLTGVILLTQVIGVSLLKHSAMMEGLNLEGLSCALMTTFVSFVTGAFFLWRMRRGASEKIWLSAFAIVFASFGSGGISILLHCNIDNAMHAMIWHILTPFATTALIGVPIGIRLLKW